MSRRPRPSPLALLALVLAPFAGASAQGTAVVELFTSQGCSSCPPADAVLGEIAGEPGVIALSQGLSTLPAIAALRPAMRAAQGARNNHSVTT